MKTVQSTLARIRGLAPIGCLPLVLAAMCGCAVTSTDERSSADDCAMPAEALEPSTRSTEAGAGSYLVVLRTRSATRAVAAASAAEGAMVTRVFSLIPAFAATLDGHQVEALRRSLDVERVEPDHPVTLATIQQGARFGLDRIDQTTGTNGAYNDFGFDGSGTHIYVVDTGVRTTHQEFTGRIGTGFSAVGGGVTDCNGHGTHVASSAAGTVYGVAKKATVHPVRVMGCSGSGTTADLIAGLEWVAQNAEHPAVANVSLLAPPSPTLDQAVEALIDTGVVVTVAAGNYNYDACLFSPSRVVRVLTVAATNAADARPGFSNFGACVDVFAPGVDVLGASYNADGATSTMSGTSMAAPHVAGAAALYLDRYPMLPPEDVAAGVLAKATIGVVQSPSGSPNRLLFSDFGAVDPDSCFGYCGIGAPSNCFCDDLCTYFGDCCLNYLSACF